MHTNGHGRRHVDDRLIAALVAGASYRNAAQTVGVSLSTVRRRMNDGDFRARVMEERTAFVETVKRRLLVVDAALRRMPPDRHQMFLLEMNAIADRI